MSLTLPRFPTYIPRYRVGRKHEALAAYLRVGSQKEAAQSMGVSHDYFRQLLSELYDDLGVNTHLEAMHALGWVKAPE